jgi:hypothetical protein
MKGMYLFALATVVACASGTTQRASIPTSSDRNVITEEEIRTIPASNVYDLVQKLRPNMLRPRGQSTLGGTAVSDYAVVFVDGRSYGDIGSLRSLIPSQVSMIRYYESTDAAGKFGTINGSGVIDVTTRQ